MKRRRTQANETAPAEQPPESAATEAPSTAAQEGAIGRGRGRRARQPRTTRKIGGRAARPSSEAAVVVEALLKSRGFRGATQEDLQQVVAWAQQTRAEGEALRSESVPRRTRAAGRSAQARAAALRQQQAQQEKLQERLTRHSMNQALLEGVLAGRVALDVQNGQLIFKDGQSVGAAFSPTGSVGEASVPQSSPAPELPESMA